MSFTYENPYLRDQLLLADQELRRLKGRLDQIENQMIRVVIRGHEGEVLTEVSTLPLHGEIDVYVEPWEVVSRHLGLHPDECALLLGRAQALLERERADATPEEIAYVTESVLGGDREP